MFVLRIDVGKDNLHFHFLKTTAEGPPKTKGQARVFPNSLAGHQSLRDWLSAKQALPQCTSVVMEATGVYWEGVAAALYAAVFAVSVVNAAQIKFFARSTLRRGKTDTMDAENIARYGVTMHPARWIPSEESLNELRALIHERDTIVELTTTLKGRQHALDHRHEADPMPLQLSRDRMTLLCTQSEQITLRLPHLGKINKLHSLPHITHGQCRHLTGPERPVPHDALHVCQVLPIRGALQSDRTQCRFQYVQQMPLHFHVPKSSSPVVCLDVWTCTCDAEQWLRTTTLITGRHHGTP